MNTDYSEIEDRVLANYDLEGDELTYIRLLAEQLRRSEYANEEVRLTGKRISPAASYEGNRRQRRAQASRDRRAGKGMKSPA